MLFVLIERKMFTFFSHFKYEFDIKGNICALTFKYRTTLIIIAIFSYWSNHLNIRVYNITINMYFDVKSSLKNFL